MSVCFYIVRHGQTMFNLQGRIQGWKDSSLTPEGVRVAEQVGDRFARTRFTAAYSSDLGRAITTGRLILDRSQVTATRLKPERAFREWGLGERDGSKAAPFMEHVMDWIGLSGHPLSESNEHLPELADAICAHDHVGTAENFATIQSRLLGRIDEIADELEHNASSEEEPRVLIVSHALAIKTIVWSVAYDRRGEVAMLPNGCVCEFVHDGSLHLVSVS